MITDEAAPHPRPALPVPLACALISVAVAAVPVLFALEAAGWHPSGLVRMSAREPMADVATEADSEFAFVHPNAHYDGVYFYAIALDPVATGESHELIDKASYRYSHAGYGWLAALLSFGRASLVPTVMLGLALVAVGVTGAALAALFAELGWSPWWGLTAAFNAGLVYSVTALTSEPIGAALLALSLLLWLRGKHAQAAPLLVALCVMKEPFVLVPIGLAFFEMVAAARSKVSVDLLRRLVLLGIGPALFVAWYVYLRSIFGSWPHEAAEGFFYAPFAGWIESLERASLFATGEYLVMQIGAASAPLLGVVFGLLLWGLVAIRVRTLVDPVYLLMFLLTTRLGPLALLYPKDLIRITSILLLLLPLVIMGRRRAAA